MKKHILFILLFIANITVLNANKSVQVDIKASCSDPRSLFNGDLFKTSPKKEEFSIRLSSNKLDLSKEAVQENIDGYVDIPEDSYYLKSNNNIYKLDGVVENLNEDKINQFISYIDNSSKIYIDTKELYSLKNSNNLKFIQKINLEKNKIKNTTTTNALDVYFDKNLLEKEYTTCEEQINASRQKLYFQATVVIFFILFALYLFKRNFQKRKFT